VSPAHTEHEAPHSGDIFALQKSFLRGDAWLDATARDLVTVGGPDRLVWLNSLITQYVLDLSPGITRESLILSPQGRVEHSFLATDDGHTTWLLLDAGSGEGLAAWLGSMKFRMDVVVTHRLGDRVIGFVEEMPVSSPPLHPLVTFSDPWPHIGGGSIGYADEPHLGADWSMNYAVVATEDAVGLSSLPRIDDHGWNALAIAAGRPSRAEVDGKTLPHELDWLRTAVHLNKGCYRGQESVAKVHNLGHPPRRLTLLHLDGSLSTLPHAGDSLHLGDKVVGVITRAAWHYELGPIALALMKRMAEVNATLEVHREGVIVAANQEVIVPQGAGAARPRPKLR
jgi:hypothetical protein